MKSGFFDFIKIILIAIFFIIALLITNFFQTEISAYLDFGYWGMIFYVLLGITATVLAPISTIPLIPVATALWGAFITATLSVIAWSIGAVIAFVLARNYGKPILKKYVDIKKVSQYENLFGEKYIFWNIVLLRMMIPVDILSYAIGLFSSINLRSYIMATIIGITPFAFVLAYLPDMDLSKQIPIGIFIIFIAFLGYKKMLNQNKNSSPTMDEN
ncbi:MAG: VTT domain-containing protein [Candidatus Paceibacterota bacterium]